MRNGRQAKEKRTSCDKRFLFGCAVAFSCMVLAANYNLFMPIRPAVFSIVGVFVGGSVVGFQLLKLLSNLQICAEDKRVGLDKQGILLCLGCFAMFMIVNLLYLFSVTYPGALTPDSLASIEQILEGYTSNHHPFWYTAVVAVFVKVGLALLGDLNAAVALYSVFQINFMAVSFTYGIATLHKAGVSKKIILLCGIVYALAPYHIAYSVTMWKDVMFGGAALLMIVSMYRIIGCIGKYKWLNTVVFGLASLGFCLWRTNGLYAYAAMVAVFLLIPLLDKVRRSEMCKQFGVSKLLGVMAGVLLCSWFLRGPVIEMMDLKQPDAVESYSIPIQQVAYVITFGRELTGEQIELIDTIVDIEKVPARYIPYISDSMKMLIREKNPEYFAQHQAEYFKLWLELGLKYPGDYVKAWIEQTKGYWNGGYEYWIYESSIIPNEYGLSTVKASGLLTAFFDTYFDFFDNTLIAQPWKSIGLHVWALLAVVAVNVVNKKKEFLLTVPIVAVILTLLIATPVFAEFRYAYAVFTTLPFVGVVSLLRCFGKTNVE